MTLLFPGTAIPEGPTAYVLTHETGNKDEFWIWNAGTGEHYPTRDNNCPLQTIGCVINHENVSATRPDVAIQIFIFAAIYLYGQQTRAQLFKIS